MKKLLLLLTLTSIAVMCFASCGTVSEFDTASQTVSAFSAMSDDTATTAQYYETAQTTQSSVDDIQSDEYKITITAGETTLNAVWEKNATTDYLVEQMPFTVPMMDLYGREMCYRYGAYALPTDDLRSDGYEVGDIAYWPPGGSLVILYKQNGEEFERQHLGHIDSGVELFETTGDIDVTFALEEPTEYSYTIQDVRNLLDFLLGRSTEENLSGKPYDLNDDGKWNAVDLTLMKRELLPVNDSDTLVIYFSRTGNTEKIAQYLIELTGADSYVIEAAVPYTDADIKYQDDNCRVNKEQNDKTVRPEIANPIASIDSYDTIFLGYPIWWGQEPRIIDTFLESYDFSEKTLIPFCTSGSSGIGTSEQNIKELVPIGNQLAGKRFSASATKDDVKAWYDTLPLHNEKAGDKLKISVNGAELTATLEDNSSAKALAELLKKGALTIEMSDYGSFEKVGDLPQSLPRNDETITTVPGDIILYQGNKITIYYDENTWNFTKLGHIDHITQEELKAMLGGGDVTVTLSN